MLQQWIARQFRLPKGALLGPLWGRIMNRGNRPMISAAIEHLQVGPSHRVLEVGFGGGAGLDLLLARAHNGEVVGTELSSVLLRGAQARYREEISRGLLSITLARVEELPVASASFDRAVTINTIYFWSDVQKGIRELHRILRPGGRLVIGFRPPEVLRAIPFTRHEFTTYSPEQVGHLLEEAGFFGIRVEEHPNDPAGSVSAVAQRQVDTPA